VLGVTADDAHRAALTLLRFPHPAVGLALSVWHDAALEHARIGGWLRDLPRGLARAGIPARPELDRWANDATRNLIPIVRTASAGLVGASSAMSTNSLLVISVVAEPSVTPATAVAAAHEVARLACRLPCEASVPSLFDLPADGHAWSITEQPIDTSEPDERQETASVVIPAWTVRHTVDLAGDPAFGFTLADDAVRRALPPIPEGYVVGARRTAIATCGQYGFEAGAVTGVRPGHFRQTAAAAPGSPASRDRPLRAAVRGGRGRLGTGHSVEQRARVQRLDHAADGSPRGLHAGLTTRLRRPAARGAGGPALRSWARRRGT
jgi:hypothetical protein